MRYYKNTADGYIVSITSSTTEATGTEISKTEYTAIADAISNYPAEGNYALTESLEYVPVEEEASEAEIASAMMEVFG